MDAGLNGNHAIAIELGFKQPFGTVIGEPGHHLWTHRSNEAGDVLQRLFPSAFLHNL